MRFFNTFRERMSVFSTHSKTLGKEVNEEQPKQIELRADQIYNHEPNDETNSEVEVNQERKSGCKWIFGSRIAKGIYVVSVLLTVATVAPYLLHTYLYRNQEERIGVCSFHQMLKFECFPGIVDEVTREVCRNWDCCWDPDKLNCYHPLPSSYRLVFINETRTNNAIRNETTKSSNKDSVPSRKVEIFQPFYNLPSGFDKNYTNKKLRLIVNKVTPERLHLRLTSRNETAPSNSASVHENLPYSVNLTPSRDNNCTTVSVHRKVGKRMVFSLNCFGGLIVSDNYMEVTVILPQNSSSYGLGFVNDPHMLHGMDGNLWTLLANMTDFSPGSTMYGAHPQYLVVEDDGLSHGVLLDTSHLLDFRLQPTPAVTFRTTGGKYLDFHIVFGPTPSEVVAQMSDIPGITGKPTLPPYWALGYHLCPIGNFSTALENIKRMRSLNIPMESHCIDSEAWLKLVFENELFTFGKLFVDAERELRNGSQKVLAVAFPQVAINKPSSVRRTTAYDIGKEKYSIFLPSFHGKFFGNVSVAFPDFTHPNASSWLSDVMKRLNYSNFDGFLLHWNTPLDFRNQTEHPCPIPYEPPYLPITGKRNVSDGTLCMNVKYFNDLTHGELINKYGYMHTENMVKALKKNNAGKKRPFVVSLSTHTGSGKLGGLWGGEYRSNWPSLRQSLVHLQEASLYGIPLAGVPICGHIGIADVELCSRWFQLGAFYPLALSYYDTYESKRGPLDYNAAFSAFAAQALKLRYALLPYLYNLFIDAHRNGMPVMRPLFFEFPADPEARRQTSPYLWGKALLFIPCLERGRASVQFWLPHACRYRSGWYDFYTGEEISSKNETNGSWVTLPSPLYYINLLVRGGHVVVTQRGEVTTRLSRMTNYIVIVALDCADDTGSANGTFVLDDGESFDGPELRVNFEATSESLSVSVSPSKPNDPQHLENNGTSITISEVRVFGVRGWQNLTVTVDNLNIPNVQGNLTSGFMFDATYRRLIIKHNITLTKNHLLNWTGLVN